MKDSHFDSIFEVCALSDCILCYVCVVDRRLDVAKRLLPAANRSEVAEEKEEQRALVSESNPVKVPVLQVSTLQLWEIN